MHAHSAKSKASQQTSSTKSEHQLSRAHFNQHPQVSSIRQLQRAIGNQAVLQLADATLGSPPAARSNRPMAPTSPGQRLDARTRERMEIRFGQDFSRIRVHTDAWAAQVAQEASANAYTVGKDLVFGAGQYDPESDAGRRLVAHELAHSVQQELTGHSQPRRVLEQEATAAADLIRTDRRISIVNTAPMGVAQHQLRARGTRYPGDPQKDNLWWNLMQTPESWPNFSQHPQFEEVLLENPEVLEQLDRLPEFRTWKRGGALPKRFVSAAEAPKEPQKSSRDRFMESFHRVSTLKQKGEAALRVELPEFYGYYQRLADQAANEIREMLTFLIPVVGALGWDLAEFAVGETTSGRPIDRLQKSIGILWQLANIGMLFLGPEAKIPEGAVPPEIPVARSPLKELPGGGARFDPLGGNIIVGDLPPLMTPKPTIAPPIGAPPAGPGGGAVVLEPVVMRSASGQVTVGTAPRFVPELAPVTPAPTSSPATRMLDVAVGPQLPMTPARPVATASPVTSGVPPRAEFPGVPVVHPLEAPGPERAPVKREAPAPKSDVPVRIEAPPPKSEVPLDIEAPGVTLPEGGEPEPLQLAAKKGMSKAAQKEYAELETELRRLEPGSDAHRDKRWAMYLLTRGKLLYPSWLNVYKSNVDKARRAADIERAELKRLGWGEHQKTVAVPGGGERRLDIGEETPLRRRGVEVKAYESGKVYLTTEGILTEVTDDAKLIRYGKWQITWLFVDCEPSGPLLDALHKAKVIVELRTGGRPSRVIPPPAP